MLSDEEKAEEYFNRHKYAHDNRNGKQETIHKKIYLDGLAEGRKEKCFEQNKDGTIRPCEVMKENEQLKEKLKQINQVVGIFSHHSGDTGYGIMLTEIELRKLQDIYNGS